MGPSSCIHNALDSLILVTGDLLHQIDDGTPRLWVWNLHESFGQVEPVGRGEIVRYILWRRGVGLCVVLAARLRYSFEEERCRCNMCAICCRRLPPMRFVPFSYFCTCWNVGPFSLTFRRVAVRLCTPLQQHLGIILDAARKHKPPLVPIRIRRWRPKLGHSPSQQMFALRLEIGDNPKPSGWAFATGGSS
jgi:hypothetical protein